jgi:hypothetical protein
VWSDRIGLIHRLRRISRAAAPSCQWRAIGVDLNTQLFSPLAGSRRKAATDWSVRKGKPRVSRGLVRHSMVI